MLAVISPPRILSTCTGRMHWPLRGVYFFMEDGEVRSDSGIGPRIVRVGTHALTENSRTTLWTRLAQHRGPSTGGGNHRGSIFRLIVGTALIGRNGIMHPTWGHGNNAPKSIRLEELPLEQEVNAVLGAMHLLCLSIPDAAGPRSLRGYIERNAIALLSNLNREILDAPSTRWLGRHCDRERVRNSGLWNSNHVDEHHDKSFLQTLERAIISMGREQ
jgi:hypothetical protein